MLERYLHAAGKRLRVHSSLCRAILAWPAPQEAKGCPSIHPVLFSKSSPRQLGSKQVVVLLSRRLLYIILCTKGLSMAERQAWLKLLGLYLSREVGNPPSQDDPGARLADCGISCPADVIAAGDELDKRCPDLSARELDALRRAARKLSGLESIGVADLMAVFRCPVRRLGSISCCAGVPH